jgi:hypothetical protein
MGDITKLIEAAENGDIEAVNECINMGIDIDAKDEHSESALYKAICGGHVDIVKLLIDKGANVNSENNHHETGLFYACHDGHLEVVKLLIESGANVNYKQSEGKTPLFYVASGVWMKYHIFRDPSELESQIAPFIEIIKVLFNNGAEVDHKDNSGETVMRYAEKNSLKPIVNLLKDMGAREVDLSTTAPKASRDVNRDIKSVWTYLTDESNWGKWYGAVPRIKPGWQKGASILWPNGDKSTITSIISEKEIVTESKWIRKIIKLNSISPTSTRIEMIDIPISGTSFSDGGLGHIRELTSNLNRLKQCVEGETLPPKQEILLPIRMKPAIGVPKGEEVKRIIKAQVRHEKRTPWDKALFFTTNRLIIAETKDYDYVYMNKPEKLKKLTPEKILRDNIRNRTIPYSDITKVNMKKGRKLSACKIEIFTDSEKLEYEILSGFMFREFQEQVNFVRSIFPDKLNVS